MHYHGHRERLRARLADMPEKLADYEILELLLGYVLLRRDTKPLAKALLARFSTLHSVLDAKPEELASIPGVGAGVQNFWQVLQEVMTRYAESPLRQRDILCSPEKVAIMARQRLGKLSHEEIWVAYVDNQNRLIEWEKAAKGSTNSTAIYPRDVLERTLALKASGFIMVHNHPGGDPTPSGADIELTQRMQRAAQILVIRFVDHIIITDDACYSLINDGLL